MISIVGGYALVNSDNDNENSMLSANIKAFASKQPSAVGCKKTPGTCYVFDGDGTLVDKQRRSLPCD